MAFAKTKAVPESELLFEPPSLRGNVDVKEIFLFRQVWTHAHMAGARTLLPVTLHYRMSTVTCNNSAHLPANITHMHAHARTRPHTPAHTRMHTHASIALADGTSRTVEPVSLALL